jgi:methylated-DNA-[protein]-cysteine S-methyltransferase
MRTSTRQGEPAPGGARRGGGAPYGPRREEYFATPYGVGRLTLLGDLPVELDLPDPGRAAPSTAAGASRSAWATKLEAYFAGEPVSFAIDVAAHCRARGFTAFETDVYTALAAVPYGHAVSYRDLAHAAGRPNAYRAVGTAMSHNALPVILPCHRVIKNDGTPGLYGEDPAWKTRLLRLEGALLPGATKVARAGRAGGPAR